MSGLQRSTAIIIAGYARLPWWKRSRAFWCWSSALFLSKIIRRDVDLQDAALNLLYVLHIDPDRRISHALLHAAERMSDANLLT